MVVGPFSKRLNKKNSVLPTEELIKNEKILKKLEHFITDMFWVYAKNGGRNGLLSMIKSEKEGQIFLKEFMAFARKWLDVQTALMKIAADAKITFSGGQAGTTNVYFVIKGLTEEVDGIDITPRQQAPLRPFVPPDPHEPEEDAEEENENGSDTVELEQEDDEEGFMTLKDQIEREFSAYARGAAAKKVLASVDKNTQSRSGKQKYKEFDDFLSNNPFPTKRSKGES